MNDPFWIKLVLSFFVGGVWILLISIIAERLGSKIGGIIGGLPSTFLIAFFFIGLVHNAQFAAESTVPGLTMMIPTVVFLLLLAQISKINYFLALLTSFLFWFAAAGIVTILKPTNTLVSTTLLGLTMVISYYLLEIKFKYQSMNRVHIKYTKSLIMSRALFGGLAVALAVFMSKIGGSLLGGIFSAFPAVFVATFTIAYFSHGAAFAQALVKPLVLSGIFNIGIFLLAVQYSYPKFGLMYGTIFAYFISLLSAYAFFTFARKHIS